MSVTDKFFVDTNVILYSLDRRDAVKHDLAHKWLIPLWDRELGRVSWQVLIEFYSNALRKLSRHPDEARRIVRDYSEWNPQAPDSALVERGWHWCDEAGVNYWDALIIAAAERSSCHWLLSEDFQVGRRFGGVTVVNPFERKPAEFGLA